VRRQKTIAQLYEQYLDNPQEMEAESRDDVVHHDDDVLEDLRHHAHNYWQWAQLAGYAEGVYKEFVRTADNVEADCRRKARHDLLAAGAKCTDKTLDEAAQLMAVCQLARREQDRRYTFWKRLLAIARAVDNRLSALQSINSRQCRELALSDFQGDQALQQRHDSDAVRAGYHNRHQT